MPPNTPDVKKERGVLKTVYVHGASDDLIEVDTSDQSISEEFGAYNNHGHLIFNDGTVLRCEYGDDGVWRFKSVKMGPKTTFNLCREGVPDDANEVPTTPESCKFLRAANYSQIVSVTGPLTSVRHTTKYEPGMAVVLAEVSPPFEVELVKHRDFTDENAVQIKQNGKTVYQGSYTQVLKESLLLLGATTVEEP